MFDRHRIATLMGKELREFRANPTSVLPVTLVVFICLVLPFMVLKIVPSATGQSIANDDMLRKAVAFASKHLDEFAALTADQAAEAFLFQQFLMLFLIAPLLGGVALAAHSVVGEKQGKTLEPLLTTPVGTSELLVAKVLAAFLPSLVIEVVGLILYLLMIMLIGQIVGAFVVTITTLILMAVAMAVAWGLLVMLSVALFDRENILTRWR